METSDRQLYEHYRASQLPRDGHYWSDAWTSIAENPAAALDAISSRGCLRPFDFAIRCNFLVVGACFCIRDYLVGFDIDGSLRLGGRLPSADPRVDGRLKSVTVSIHV